MEGENVVTQLNQFDEWMMMYPPTTTLTFYKAHSSPIDILTLRVQAVVLENSWLASRIQTGTCGKIVLTVPLAPKLDRIVEDGGDIGLEMGMEYNEVLAKVVKRQVQIGSRCLDQDEPLFRAILFRAGPGHHALLVSMSHVLGDGHTFYQVYKMLDPSAPVRPMSRAPIERHSEILREAIGIQRLDAFYNVDLLEKMLIGGSHRPKPNIRVSFIDMAVVEDEKRRYLSSKRCEHDPPYVSTNDVLTSWWMKLSGAIFSTMHVNLRGKFHSLVDTIAGNLIAPMSYFPEEFATSAGIRKALLSAPSLSTGRQDVPLAEKFATKDGYLDVVTNWSSFYHEVELPGCEHIVHLPIYSKEMVLGSMAIIFKPTKNTLGALLYARNEKVMGTLSTSPMLRGDVLQAQIRSFDSSCVLKPGDDNHTLHGLFQAALAKRPDHMCLKMLNHCGLTYRQVDCAVSRCAAHVVMLNDPCIALIAQRSYSVVVSLLAILKTGKAYCPVDVDFPLARIYAMFEIGGMQHCLIPAEGFDETCLTKLPETQACIVHSDGQVECFDGTPAPLYFPSLLLDVVDTTTAYVIFTSGSTGKPKGCSVPHRGSAKYARANAQACKLDENMVFLHKTPYTFDVHVSDIFTPFAVCATLVIADPGAHLDPLAITRTIIHEKVSCVPFVPCMLVEFLRAVVASSSAASLKPHLKRVFACGEALLADTCRLCSELFPDVEIHNLYGPTEASVAVSHHYAIGAAVDEGPVVPIGQPFSYVKFKVFDPECYDPDFGFRIEAATLVLVPEGDAGELFIGGDCLAKGYLANPEQTNLAFFHIPNVLPRVEQSASPFSLYKTGDLVRSRRDGVYDYLGRTDFQVKINGVRIECGEVESFLRTHPAVEAALVMTFKSAYGEGLVAYIVVEDGHDWKIDAMGLLQFEEDQHSTSADSRVFNTIITSIGNCDDIVYCNQVMGEWTRGSSLLPAMRPAVYVPLPFFPKNAAGKVNRSALPDALHILEVISGARSKGLGESEEDLPQTAEEKKMAGCWEQVLKTSVRMTIPFIAYGGHSLIALQLRSEVNRIFGMTPNLAFLMSGDCTVRNLMEKVRKHDACGVSIQLETAISFPFVCERSMTAFYHMPNSSTALLCAVHPILHWIPARLITLTHFYYVPTLTIMLESVLDDLEHFVRDLLCAHPILRSEFNKRRQLVIKDNNLSPRTYYSIGENLQKVRHDILGLFDRPLFHIIAQCRHESNARTTCRLTIVWHHIITDAFSGALLRQDITALARGERLRPPADLGLYMRVARHPLTAPASEAHPFDFFTLPPSRSRLHLTLGKILHRVTMFVAISRNKFGHEMDKVRFFLDSWCQVTGQRQGRFGLVTNARAKVEEDTTRLLGSLLFNLEYTYDSVKGELKPRNCSMVHNVPALTINMRYEDEDVEHLVARLGYGSPHEVVAGNVEASIMTHFTGAFGLNFADDEGIYVECLNAPDATMYVGIFQSSRYNAVGKVRDLIGMLQTCRMLRE